MALLTLTTVLLTTLGLGCLLQWLPARGQPKPTYPQRAPFLGGGSPDTHAWNRYHIRYYPMTLLLIAFEMEMMFMYPWAVVFVEKGATAVMEMGMFLAILAVGIVYAWREGVFRWQ
ncbi:NADH-quinone oxidoreductase subunit A [Halomonas sp. MCCC 1A17488]|uniref:NADH-quinone oxidoreductase subunit n=1 Tax=Billgrantia sulfidoxydans TaxID=2733484 RepID=A0ABX7W1F0_9GAMM|nr:MULTISPECIES: NADH-quinone oxidoreductase subunit A [Halomonas]MCE8016367.1 NADH-quinone oxidoreductase subunit A [Halomonas sp. MCCC 1A17488]MCG3239700.1 NADH-quinone oxidoreductase subunit A [Halomonas sp. MCCC 1A17488]QPP50391.1 NADH-quinone oxidoreductase subunit A [Halomonas sp. SS10-MC5]QTP54010.1 NADH-quinone oxidoreductase subunit A [Halomonas sulfidoxydans]